MKKNLKLIIVFLLSLFVFGCDNSNTHNEIYNTTYSGTVSITEFEDLVEAVIETTQDSLIGVSNYVYSIGGMKLKSVGSGVVFNGTAELQDGTRIPSKDVSNGTPVKKFYYQAITNQHVIDGAITVKVYYDSDKPVEIVAKVEKDDALLDLALISFETNFNIPTLEFGDSENLKSGAFVVALGCPNGLDFYQSSSFGIVSHPRRYIEETVGSRSGKNEYIQHDASISPGNSGGPLINMEGKIIGINSMKINKDGIDGMGFAIPSNVVKEFINNDED